MAKLVVLLVEGVLHDGEIVQVAKDVVEASHGCPSVGNTGLCDLKLDPYRGILDGMVQKLPVRTIFLSPAYSAVSEVEGGTAGALIVLDWATEWVPPAIGKWSL